MRETNSKIFAVLQVKQAAYRALKIDGHPKYVKQAIKKVVRFVERLTWKFKLSDPLPKPVSDNQSSIKVKVVLQDNYLPKVLGNEGSFVNHLSHHYKVKVVIYKNKKIRCLENDESIMVELVLTSRNWQVV